MTPDAPDRDREVLAERARLLARPLAAPDAGARVPMAAFTLAREQYLVDARLVLAAFRLDDFTPLPGAEPPVVGLTAWRGIVLTLVDLRAAAGGSAAGLDDLSRVLVLGHEQPVCGLLADVVHGVEPFDEAQLLPAPVTRAAVPGLLRGVTRDARLVLDGAQLLALLADAPAPPPPSDAPASVPSPSPP